MLKVLFLSPFSLLYFLLSKANSAFTTPQKLSHPVISIGNITWGGTGKTPLVIKLARYCIENGVKPAVLSRGYRRKSHGSGSVIVSDGEKIVCSLEDAGDEPFSIAKSVPGAIVVSGTNRRESATAAEKYLPGVFILDDGFQHWKIQRDLDIVCVNALDPFGNGMLIPAGKLREPVSSVKRAGLVVITSSDMVDPGTLEKIKTSLGRHCKGLVIDSELVAVRVRSLLENTVYDIKAFPFRKVIALSALGNNKGFLKTIEKSGFDIEHVFAYKDHHWFNTQEVNRVIYKMGETSCVLVTTKDEEKLKLVLMDSSLEAANRFFVLETDMNFTSGGPAWQEIIKRNLRFS